MIQKSNFRYLVKKPGHLERQPMRLTGLLQSNIVVTVENEKEKVIWS